MVRYNITDYVPPNENDWTFLCKVNARARLLVEEWGIERQPRKVTHARRYCSLSRWKQTEALPHRQP